MKDVNSQRQKHTPGPWHYSGPYKTEFSSEFFHIGNDNISVCQTGGDVEVKEPNNLEEQIANAILISVAPELLEVCSEALLFIQNLEKIDSEIIEIKLKNIIAKAKGEI